MRLHGLPGLVFVLAAGCAGRFDPYPGTDVLLIPGFSVESAADLEQSGGSLQRGTLVYRGEGVLKEVFQEYLRAMRKEGWVATQTAFNDETGMATLRKDNRIATLEFSDRKEIVTVSVRVTGAAGVE